MSNNERGKDAGHAGHAGPDTTDGHAVEYAHWHGALTSSEDVQKLAHSLAKRYSLGSDAARDIIQDAAGRLWPDVAAGQLSLRDAHARNLSVKRALRASAKALQRERDRWAAQCTGIGLDRRPGKLAEDTPFRFAEAAALGMLIVYHCPHPKGLLAFHILVCDNGSVREHLKTHPGLKRTSTYRHYREGLPLLKAASLRALADTHQKHSDLVDALATMIKTINRRRRSA